MPRPKSSATGKVTEFRRDLDTYRQRDRDRFDAEIARVKEIYRRTKSIAKTSKELAIGKRTLERAIKDIAELSAAIDSVRVILGR